MQARSLSHLLKDKARRCERESKVSIQAAGNLNKDFRGMYGTSVHQISCYTFLFFKWRYLERLVNRCFGYNNLSQCCKTMTSKALETTGYLVISLILTRGRLGLVSVYAQTQALHMCRLLGGEMGRRTRLAAVLAKLWG